MIQPKLRLLLVSSFLILVLFAFRGGFELLSAVELSGQAQHRTLPIIVLEPGLSIEREQSGGQATSYSVALSQGQYARIVLEQRGIDVRVQVFRPDQKIIAVFDSEARIYGQETVEFVADTDGNYSLDVRSKWAGQLAGSYQIVVTQIRPATADDRNLQEARILDRESFGLYNERKLDEAGMLAWRSLNLYEGVLGTRHPALAGPHNTLAWIDRYKGDFVAAEAHLQQAIRLTERALGAEHPRVSEAVNALGVLHYVRGEHSKAEPLFLRAIANFEKTLGRDHYLVTIPLLNMANIHEKRGDYAEAIRLSNRILTIQEQVLGKESVDVARRLQALAGLYERVGDFAMAEALHGRTLSLMEVLYGEQSLDVSVELENFGEFCRNKGDYARARSMFERSLAIREKLYPSGHASIAFALYELANLSSTQGNDATAEPLYLRAVEMWERTEGLSFADIPLALRGLAAISSARGDDGKSEALYLRALRIQEKQFDATHPNVALMLNELANIQRDRGEFLIAESSYERALKILENSLGANHPNVALVLSNLSTLYAMKGSIAEAITLQARANAINEHNLSLNLASGSERWKLASLTSLINQTNKTISLAHVAASDARASELAASAVLQRKGRVQDAMFNTLVTIRQRAGLTEQKLLEELNQTTAQLAALALSGVQGIAPSEHRKQITFLEERKDRLEEEISRRSAELRAQLQPVTLNAVQAAIPDNAAFIDFAVYRPTYTNPTHPSQTPSEPRFVAYVIRSHGDVQARDLGNAKSIEISIDRFRQSLRNPKRQDVRESARALDEKVMSPLRPLLGGIVQLLISPDGLLNLIPFEALVDEQNRYLVERYSFTYLTSGRDLLRMQVRRESTSNPVVVANPLFGEPELTETSRLNRRPIKANRQSVTTGSDLSEVYFAPLSGTGDEARAIRSLFVDATVVTGEHASESFLKQVSAPRMLHIATHGFFLTDTTADSLEDGENTRAIRANIKVENPLLRSGLALAGANLPQGIVDDGILTALEASGLNLWGTKLVVLSACDTGIGEVKNGEGVYGLRRAFLLAGTETLVMSLWAVSDYATRQLMTSYYSGLKRGQGRGEALRQAQLNMLKSKGRDHPFYWASFIQSGEWANLDGRRDGWTGDK